MSIEVCIAAVSARTPLGLTAESSAAAVRGGLSRVRSHPYMVDMAGGAVMGAFDARLEPGLQGPLRLWGLLAGALHELSFKLGIAGRAPKLPLWLGVPELRPGFGPHEEQTLLAHAHRAGLELSGCRVVARGHAAALHGIGQAARAIQSGQLEGCIVAGVDSYFDADTIDWLIAKDQLAREGSRSPFVPGEAAGCVAVLSTAAARRAGLPILAIIRGAHSAEEQSVLRGEPVNLARALTDCIAQAGALAVTHGLVIDQTWCDLNGERQRTDEWTYVQLRKPQLFRYAPGKPATYETAVDCWGDVGAASGALLTTLAVQSWSRAYAKGPVALTFAASEGGLRSAVLLQQGVR